MAEYTVSLGLQVQQVLRGLQQATASFLKLDKEVDDVTGSLNKFEQELKEQGRTVANTANAQAKYIKKLQEMANGLDKNSAKFKIVNRQLDAFTKKTQTAGNAAGQLATALGGIGAGFAVQRVISGLSQTGIALQEQQGAVRTLAGNDYPALQKSINQVVKETDGLTTATEANAAAYQLLSAGVSGAENVSSTLGASINLAKGGFTDTTTAVDGLTTVMNAYGIAASDATKISDMFLQTQNDGKIVVGEYAANIGKLAPLAASLKVPLEEVNAAIASVTAQGLNAEIGITAIRSAIAKLAAPTKEGSDILSKYKIQIDANTIAQEGLLATLQKLTKVTDKVDLTKLLGTEAGQAIFPLLGNLERFEELIEKQKNSAGATAQAVKELSGSYADLSQRLNNEIKGLQEQIFTEIAPVLLAAAKAARALVEAFAGLPAPVRQALLAVAGLVAVAGSIAGIVATLGLIKAAFVAAGGAATVFAGGLGVIKAGLIGIKIAAAGVLAVAPWLALAAGVAAVGYAVYENVKAQQQYNRLVNEGEGSQQEFRTAIESVKNELVEAKNKLQGTGGEIKATGRQAVQLQKEIRQLEADLKSMEGTYYIKLKLEREGWTFDGKGNAETYEVSGIRYDAKSGRAINPPATVSDIKEAEAKAKALLDSVTPPAPTGGGRSGGGGGGGGGGSKGPDKQAEGAKLIQQLEREIQLLQTKDALEKQLLQIKFDQADLEKQIVETAAAGQQEQLLAAAADKARLQSSEAVLASTEASMAAAKEFVKSGREEAELLALKQQYMADGIEPSLANQYASIDQQVNKLTEGLDIDILRLENQIALANAAGVTADELERQLAAAQGLKGEIQQSGKDRKARIDNEPQKGKVEQYMDKLRADLEDTGGMIVSLAQTVESEIGSAMSNAISGLIDGTQTASAAFSQMFKNIGKAFIDMATQMIAKAMVLKVLGIFGGGASGAAGAGGGFSGGGGYGQSAPQLFTGGSIFDTPFSTFSGGGYTGDAPRVGGLDGEGGFMAMLHPQETVIDHARSNSSLSKQAPNIEKTVIDYAQSDSKQKAVDHARPSISSNKQAPNNEKIVIDYAQPNSKKTVIDYARSNVSLNKEASGIEKTVIDYAPANGRLNKQAPDVENIAKQLNVPALAKSFAGGGYTGNTPRSGGLDGQGGYMAMIHPDETIIDHRSPMGRYSNSNSDSNSLSDGGDARTSMSRYRGGNNRSTGGGTSTIKFESRIINNVEYVTAEQAMAMSRRAADDGAKRGMEGGYTRSMQTLRNSRSQRAKIGMS